MIRLTFLLCFGLYVALLILGEDNGQKRYGLMMADQQPKAEQSDVVLVAEPVKPKVFIPAQTVMQPKPVSTAPAEVVAATDVSLPTPDVPGGTLFVVASSQANVRLGPGKSFDVLDTLNEGEQLLVVDDPDAPEGWSHVRIEGDGTEGYVATRLLRKLN